MIPLWGPSGGAGAVFSQAAFWASLTHSLVLDAGTGSPTFTRATEATFRDHEGVLRTVPAGCARFEGARRVRNLLTFTEDFSNAIWSITGITRTATTITETATGTDHSLRYTVASGKNIWQIKVKPNGRTRCALASTGSTNKSAIFNLTTGVVEGALTDAFTTLGDNPTITMQSDGYYLITMGNLSGTSTLVDLYILDATSTVRDYAGDITKGLYVKQAQLEDITGRTDQTTPSEYVSVGVPGDWAGDELVTNGTFDSDTTGWNSGRDPVSWSSGMAKATSVAADGAYLGTAISVMSGVKYVISAESVSDGVSVAARTFLGTALGNGDIVAGPSGYIFGHTTFEYTSSVTGTIYLWFYGLSVTPGNYILVDNISVKPAIYHGSGVDGVKYFNTDLSGNPLPTEYTYDAVSLNGVAGTYVSTPDSVAASVTGDIDIRVKAALTDWTPAVNGALLSKRTSTGQYLLVVLTNGLLEFDWWDAGGTNQYAISTSVTGITDGTASFVRATLDVDNGAGGCDVRFYKSADGVTWTQIGTTVTQAFITSIRDTTDTIEVGSQLGGVSDVSGKIYRAQIYNGINGTLAVDFDASRYAGGTTLTGSTGETWTLQGNAVIHPTNNPNTGYVAEGAGTNLCLQSNAFTTTWTNTFDTSAQNVVGPDGATSAWTLTDSSAVAARAINQIITLTAAAWTASIFIKKTSGATTFPIIEWCSVVGTTEMAAATIDTNNGIATLWTSFSGYTMASGMSAACVSHNDSYWRVSLTKTGTAATHYIIFFAAGTTNAAQSTGGESPAAQGSAVFYGAQVELGSFASSYIPTTTIAVARNADVLTYSSSGNISGTVGAAYCEIKNNWVTAVGTSEWALSFNTAGAGMLDAGDNSSLAFRAYDGTNVVTATAGNSNTSVVAQAMAWGGTTLLAARSGTVASGTFDGDMSPTAIYPGGYNQIQGTIRNVRIWQRALSSSELQAVTA